MRRFFRPRYAGPERRLRLVEGDGVVEDAGPGPRDPGHQGGGHVAAVLTGEAGSPVCALKAWRCMLFAQSSFSMSIRAWSSRR